MEIIKKSNIEFLFIFFLTFGYIFFYSFSRQLDTSNEYFAVPFRVVLFLVSCYIIVVNFENLKKRKLSVIFTALFWLFYLAKSIYSFKNDSYQQKILNNEEKIYIRILCLNLIPYIAVLSIN
ncbi:hypothetical protein, partial [Chryseobacterium arthrosphaerae]